MTFALEMSFDAAADAAIRRMWNRLDQAGISSLATTSHRKHRPHVTLAVARRFTIDAVALDVIRELPGTEITLPALGVFPGEQGVLFAGAKATADLLRVHSAIHTAIECASDDLWELYQPGQWVPHCTLAMRLGARELSTAMSSLYPYSAITASVDHVNLVEIESGQMEPLV